MVVRRASLAEIFPLRHAVLRPGLPAASAAFEGDDEPATRHFAACAADGALAGCASFMRRPWRGEPAWQLRGMATHPERTRHGVGTTLLAAAEALLRAEGDVRLLWCNARLAAVPFYQRVGWEVASAVFDIPGVGPHHAMTRRLPSP